MEQAVRKAKVGSRRLVQTVPNVATARRTNDGHSRLDASTSESTCLAWEEATNREARGLLELGARTDAMPG